MIRRLLFAAALAPCLGHAQSTYGLFGYLNMGDRDTRDTINPNGLELGVGRTLRSTVRDRLDSVELAWCGTRGEGNRLDTYSLVLSRRTILANDLYLGLGAGVALVLADGYVPPVGSALPPGSRIKESVLRPCATVSLGWRIDPANFLELGYQAVGDAGPFGASGWRVTYGVKF